MFGQVWLIRIVTILLAASVVNSQWAKYSKKDSSCLKPTLKNGKVKMRSGGRVVKFNCKSGYYIVGETTATCLRKQWTSEPPVCAAKGCPDIAAPESGRFVKMVFGTVLVVECNPGYILNGSPMLYCDKFEWNGTTPLCEASGTKSSLSCDFEDDLCGWIQDSIDDFDWTRQNLGTPSGHLGTGPSYDHTLGETKAGYYLYIESSSPRIINDTARIYSPVYGPDSVSDGCFTFWYHMYGSSTGQLRVYVKVESQKLEDVDASFIRSGDQGQRWHQGYIPLPNINENFQMVIEGVRGPGYVSDTAIDDVKLTSGEECKMAAIASQSNASDDEKPNSNTPTASNSSCFSRCSTTGTADESVCSCHDSCLLNATCCMDYINFCLTESREENRPTLPAGSEEEIPITTQPASLLSTTASIAKTESRLHKDDVKETEIGIATTMPSDTSTLTIVSTTSNQLSDYSTTPLKATAITVPADSTIPLDSTILQDSIIAQDSTIHENPTISTVSTSTQATITSTAQTTTSTIRLTSVTWVSSQSAITVTTSTTQPTQFTVLTISTTSTEALMTTNRTASMSSDHSRESSTSTTASTASTSALSSWRPYPDFDSEITSKTSGIDDITLPPPSSSTIQILIRDGVQSDDSVAYGESRFNNPDEDSSSSTFIGSVAMVTGIGGAVTGFLLVTTLVIISLIRWWNRRLITSRQNHNQDLLADDSDVRYLRDEDDVQLDLTEATPRANFADFHQL